MSNFLGFFILLLMPFGAKEHAKMHTFQLINPGVGNVTATVNLPLKESSDFIQSKEINFLDVSTVSKGKVTLFEKYYKFSQGFFSKDEGVLRVAMRVLPYKQASDCALSDYANNFIKEIREDNYTMQRRESVFLGGQKAIHLTFLDPMQEKMSFYFIAVPNHACLQLDFVYIPNSDSKSWKYLAEVAEGHIVESARFEEFGTPR